MSHAVLLPLWVAATVGIIWWLARRPALLDRAESFLTLTGGMLVAWFVVSIGVTEYRSARALRASAVVRRLAEPIRVRPGAQVGPKERLGAFGAYYLPGQGGEAFGDTVTIVNVLGNVLRSYLGADLPREPDDMYLSVDQAPLAFRRVDFAWLAREDWSVRPSVMK